MEMMLAVKTHRQITGEVHPQGHVMSLAGGGIALRQLAQDLPLCDGPEEIRFADLAEGSDTIKLSTAKGLQHQRLVAFKQHSARSCYRSLVHLRGPRDAGRGSDPLP